MENYAILEKKIEPPVVHKSAQEIDIWFFLWIALMIVLWILDGLSRKFYRARIDSIEAGKSNDTTEPGQREEI